MKKEDLEQFDGKDENPAYIAYKGKVLDVSRSKLWKNGRHMNQHSAGQDLTDVLPKAPHGTEVFERVESIGVLENDTERAASKDRKEVLRDLYRMLHPHPMLVHFPMGSLFLGATLQVLFLLTRDPSFETASFYAFVFGTLFVFPVMMSGIFSWWLNYDLVVIVIFKRKLLFSIVLLTFCLFVVMTRFMVADIAYQDTLLSRVYSIMVFATISVLPILGFYGGKITWQR